MKNDEVVPDPAQVTNKNLKDSGIEAWDPEMKKNEALKASAKEAEKTSEKVADGVDINFKPEDEHKGETHKKAPAKKD